MWDKADARAASLEDGGSKKFLYSGPIRSKAQRGDDDAFFSPKSGTNGNPRGLPVDLDNVWSIRNVGLTSHNMTSPNNSAKKSARSEPSTLKNLGSGMNTSSVYYSRHGGMKGGKTVSSQGDNLTSNPSTGSQWSSSGHHFGQSRQISDRMTSQRSNSEGQRQGNGQSPRDINDF